jgi:hypothetical protein
LTIKKAAPDTGYGLQDNVRKRISARRSLRWNYPGQVQRV